MRKAFVVGTVIVSLFAFAPSHARVRQVAKKQILFKASTPCFVACAHNMEGNLGIPFDLASSGNPFSEHFSSCGKPGPAGSYADFVVTVPKKTNTLVFSIFPKGDWDSYICSKPARGPSVEVANGANTIDENNPEVLGVSETTAIAVKPGQKYILRAYNWADNAHCPGEYKFLYMS